MDAIFENITVNTDYFAVYEISTYYTVTWKDEDGRLMRTESVKGGTSAVPPDEASKEGYRRGWDKPYDYITSDLELKAVYVKVWTVRYLDWDDSILKECMVDNGESGTPPENPSREGYRFSSWTGSDKNVISNVDVKAYYKEINLELVYYYTQYSGDTIWHTSTEYLYFPNHNFEVNDSDFGEGEGTICTDAPRANMFKIAAEYDGKIIPISQCKVTLEEKSIVPYFKIDYLKGVITRTLGDAGNPYWATETSAQLTIEYAGKKYVSTLNFRRGGIVFELDWSAPGPSGGTWFALRPKFSGYSTYLSMSANDIKQFTVELRDWTTGSSNLSTRITNGPIVRGVQTKFFEINIPTSVPNITGQIVIHQKRENGFYKTRDINLVRHADSTGRGDRINISQNGWQTDN